MKKAVAVKTPKKKAVAVKKTHPKGKKFPPISSKKSPMMPPMGKRGSIPMDEEVMI